MRAKTVALLVLALGCGAVASVGIVQVIAKRGTDPAPVEAETQAVFTALKDVSQGDPLSGENVKLEQWPKDKVPAGALGRLEDIDGRRTRSKLYAGEPILDKKLAAKGVNTAGADIMIPKGYRVVSIRVDAVSGGADLLLPGCRVDLLVHMAKNPSVGINETTTRTVLQDIKVFAVNNVVTIDATGPETKSIPARTVSLLVTPAQAERVTLASELGSIKLVMRGPEEEVQERTKGTRPSDLFGESDKAERDKESEAGKSSLTTLKETGKGVLDYLNELRKQADAAKPAVVEPAEESWSMRILAGGEVNDVTMRGAANAALADAGAWSVSGLKSGGNSGGSAAPRHTPPPAPEQKPAKTESGPSDGGNGGRANQAGQPGGSPMPAAS
jgi:pilus assembly protein CpaB